MKIAYGRVSTVIQDTALQEDAFRRAGADKVVTEKWSSVGKRPQLMELLSTLTTGDVLVVYKLDRLGRSLQDLLEILNRITASGAVFLSLTEAIDTSTPAGKLMYSILGAVAEFERSLIRQRSIAGQVAAVERGVKIGRPRKLSPAKESALYRDWLTGAFTQSALCQKYHVHSTVVRRVIYAAEKPSHPWVRQNRPVIGPLLAAGCRGGTP